MNAWGADDACRTAAALFLSRPVAARVIATTSSVLFAWIAAVFARAAREAADPTVVESNP